MTRSCLVAAGRVFSWLLHAYPARFRARFGTAMQHSLARDHAAARARGTGAHVAFWIMTIAETLWFAAAERGDRGVSGL